MPLFLYVDGCMLLDRLAHIESRLDQLLWASRKEEARDKMAQADIDRLKVQVERNTSVAQSAVTLITGLADQIRAAQDDPAELQALADRLSTDADALGAAVAANTPAA